MSLCLVSVFSLFCSDASDVYASDLWSRAYQVLLQAVQNPQTQGLLNTSVTPEMVNMVGTRPPPILSMTSQAIQTALAKNTIDIGMCGFFVTRCAPHPLPPAPHPHQPLETLPQTPPFPLLPTSSFSPP